MEGTGRIGGLLGRMTGERQRDYLEMRAQVRQREWTKRQQGKQGATLMRRARGWDRGTLGK